MSSTNGRPGVLILRRFVDETFYIVPEGATPIEITVTGARSGIRDKRPCARIRTRARNPDYQVLRRELIAGAGPDYRPILERLEQCKTLTPEMITKLRDLKK